MSHPSEGSIPEWEEKYRRPVVWIVLGLVGTVALLAASTFISVYAARAVANHGEARDRAHRVRSHVHAIYSAVKDIETARRGYVMMGEEDYLDPYHGAKESIIDGFVNLRSTIHPEDERHHAIDALETQIIERVELAEQSIDLYRQQRDLTEEQRALSPMGKAAMDRIRATVEAIMLEQEQELEALWELDRQKKRQGLIAIVVGQALSIVLLVMVFGFLWGEFRRRARLQKRIEQAYQSRSATVARLTERSEQIARMGEMSDLLHVCHTSAEAYGVVGEYAPRLFSARAGAICLTAASRDQVETDSQWGELQGHEEHFSPEHCWSLRRGCPTAFNRIRGMWRVDIWTRPHCRRQPSAIRWWPRAKPSALSIFSTISCLRRKAMSSAWSRPSWNKSAWPSAICGSGRPSKFKLLGMPSPDSSIAASCRRPWRWSSSGPTASKVGLLAS